MSTKARHHDKEHGKPTHHEAEKTQATQEDSAIQSQDSPELDAIQIVETEQSDLGKAQQERDQYLNMLRRTQAEFENYQKRAAREAETERKFCQRPLAMEVIPALDNLDRFLSTVKEETELTKVVATVHKQLLDGLARQGIKRVETVGKPFDPNQEQAILEQPSDQPPGTVLLEIEAGYVYHDRVLRPAKVIVGKTAPIMD